MRSVVLSEGLAPPTTPIFPDPWEATVNLLQCFPPDWYLLICPPVKLKSTYTLFVLLPLVSLSLCSGIYTLTHIIFVRRAFHDSLFTRYDVTCAPQGFWSTQADFDSPDSRCLLHSRDESRFALSPFMERDPLSERAAIIRGNAF